MGFGDCGAVVFGDAAVVFGFVHRAAGAGACDVAFVSAGVVSPGLRGVGEGRLSGTLKTFAALAPTSGSRIARRHLAAIGLAICDIRWNFLR